MRIVTCRNVIVCSRCLSSWPAMHIMKRSVRGNGGPAAQLRNGQRTRSKLLQLKVGAAITTLTRSRESSLRVAAGREMTWQVGQRKGISAGISGDGDMMETASPAQELSVAPEPDSDPTLSPPVKRYCERRV